MHRRPEPVAERWASLAVERTNLVLAPTPSPKWLSRWGLQSSLAGAARFCESLLGPLETLPAVKLQTPFFERFGPEGIKLLSWFVARAREGGTLTIVDAKRCDAVDTMEAYGDLYLGDTSVIGADAVTVVPYMGFESCRPLVERADAEGCGVFALVRSSNHEAQVQAVRDATGASVSLHLARELEQLNTSVAPGARVGPVAAIVGASPEETRELMNAMPSALVSLPGLGRSHRPPRSFTSVIGPDPTRALLPIASGVLVDGPDNVQASIDRWKSIICELAISPVPA